MKTGLCVAFDIDDTLYLERDYVRSGFEAVGRWAARWMSLQDFGDRCWRRFAEGRRKRVFDQALEESGAAATPEVVAAMVEIYRTHAPSIALEADAAEALNALSRFASIGVISDGPIASQSRKAEALELGRLAAPIVLTGMLGSGFGKPHPKAFEHMKLCRPARVYVYVADNPAKDFETPKRLGWLTVRIRRRGGLHYAVDGPESARSPELGDCSALPELLSQL